MVRQRIGKQSDKNRKHRNHSMRRFFLLIILGIVVFVGFGILARIESMQVQLESFEGIVVTDTDDISLTVREYFESRFLYPTSNRVWFSERALENIIGDTFPRLDNVDVRSESGVLRVSAVERQGQFLWCGDVLQEIRPENLCYFADESGFIFDEAPFFAGTTFVRLYGQVDNVQPIGQYGISPDIFPYLSRISSVLQSFGFSVQAVQQYSEGQYEFILNSQQGIEQAPRIRFVVPSLVGAISNLEIALSEQDFLFEIRAAYDRLEYLDIRFTDQVVYKFRDPNTPVYAEVEEGSQDEEYVEENLEQTISEEIVSDDTEG